VLSPNAKAVNGHKIVGDGDFAEFWAVYPKKVDKVDAQKAFAARIKSGVEASTIIAGARRYAAQIAADTRPRAEVCKYTKHPATFLNKGSYANEAAPTPSSPAKEAALRLIQRSLRQ
jgi:hypothetical protein